MGEETTPQNSIVESDHSRLSEVALMEKFFPEIKNRDVAYRDRKYSRKYDVTGNTNQTEEDGNVFNWIQEQEEQKKGRRKSEKSFYKQTGPAISTLESDKTSSSCTASDFNSNVYSKNGYIRGTNDKKCGNDLHSMLKYNEFSSLMSSLGAGSNFPVEVKVDRKDSRKEEEGRHWIDEENSIFLILGGIQMMLGILMAVFGVLVIAHDSSLSGAGSGLWGGAVAMFSGLMGILAGFRGCYASDKSIAKSSRSLLSVFLAFCLVSFALSNLVVVLTATGLIRDVQRPKNQIEVNAEQDNFVNWPPVLADVGLILASALQCVAAVCSGYKCYKKVCPCLRSDHNRLSDADSHNEKYKIEGKERLVNHWLGQQLRIPNKKGKCEGQDNLVPWGTPNIVLLPPPPPMIANGQIPILTFLQAPSSVFGSSVCGHHLYSNSAHYCCRHDNRYVAEGNAHPTVHDRKSCRKINYIQPDDKVPTKTRSRNRVKKERRSSLPTAEEVAKTYTGLDREIAEEFIAIAMDKGAKRSRNNSFSEYTVKTPRQGF